MTWELKKVEDQRRNLITAYEEGELAIRIYNPRLPEGHVNRRAAVF